MEYRVVRKGIGTGLVGLLVAVGMTACGAGGNIGNGFDRDVLSDKAGQPSARATAQVGDIAVLKPDGMQWRTVLKNTLKAPANRSLFIHGSLECGLYTRTVVRSRNGERATSTASATVKARVLVNGQDASPGIITFCSRTQELTAVLQGLLTDAAGNSCLSTDMDPASPTFGTTFIDEDCVRPEEIGLLLDTMNANAFNFVAPSNGAVNTIEFQAMIATSVNVDPATTTEKKRVTTDPTVTGGEAEAYATIGKGAVLVEAVRMIQGEDWLN